MLVLPKYWQWQNLGNVYFIKISNQRANNILLLTWETWTLHTSQLTDGKVIWRQFILVSDDLTSSPCSLSIIWCQAQAVKVSDIMFLCCLCNTTCMVSLSHLDKGILKTGNYLLCWQVTARVNLGVLHFFHAVLVASCSMLKHLRGGWNSIYLAVTLALC